MIDITKLTIVSAHESLLKKEFSARELAEAYLKHIEEVNPTINAYLEVYDDVLKRADEADEIIKSGKATFLTGIPVALKDNILLKGKKATASSKILQSFVSPYDATAVTKLKDNHVVFMGRTNMDEFAMGGSTETSAYGITRNPVDPTRVPGGSSGGSVASVAMNGALLALGSDTGGSVRQPSAFCGVVGLKPTYGSISRHGLMAMGSSLDVIGPVTKTVADSEIAFKVLQGVDPLDGTTYGETIYPKKNTKKLVVGVPYHILNQEGIDPVVRKNFDESIQKIKDLGSEVKDITLPYIEYSLSIYYILMPAEVSSNLARFDGVKYGLHVEGDNLLQDYLKTRRQGFGSEVRRRILIGTYVLSSGYHDAYYNKAVALREAVAKDFTEAFKTVDVILTPTTPSPAFKIGEKINDPLSMYLADVFTVPANIAGIPALSIPSGTTSVDGVSLPLGLQLMAPHNHEHFLFELGKKFLAE